MSQELITYIVLGSPERLKNLKKPDLDNSEEYIFANFTDKDQTKPVVLKVKAGARDCYVRHRNTYIAAIKEAFFLFKSIIEKERGLV